MQIRVLGVPQTGAKSRVETQIKLCIQLVTDDGDKAQWWSHLKLPEHMVAKDKLKRQVLLSTQPNGTKIANVPGLESPLIKPEKMLYLTARVICASDPSRKVVTCLGCIQRERKRSQRRKENKVKNETDEMMEDDKSLANEEQKVLLFNCSEVVDFSSGDTILPTRITCYCRHHNERLGFCIYFEMHDHTGKQVATGMSPPIMITDDHKSNKIKAGRKRLRTDEKPTTSSSSTTTSHSNSHKRAISPAPPLSISSSTNTALDRPLLQRLIPNEGPTFGGVEVTVLGSGFRSGLTCMFGDVAASSTHYWSPNTLVCILPPAAEAGTVVVSFKEHPLVVDSQDVTLFTYYNENDRALMELALQVVGLKMTGKVEDARDIAMRIVQGGNTGGNNNSGGSNTDKGGRQNTNGTHQMSLERHIIQVLEVMSTFRDVESADVSITSAQGHTMLHLAAMLGFEKLTRTLIELGCDVDRTDKNGYTALHYCAWYNHLHVVHALLEGSADVEISNMWNKKPIHLTQNMSIRNSLWNHVPLVEDDSDSAHEGGYTSSEDMMSADIDTSYAEEDSDESIWLSEAESVDNSGWRQSYLSDSEESSSADDDVVVYEGLRHRRRQQLITFAPHQSQPTMAIQYLNEEGSMSHSADEILDAQPLFGIDPTTDYEDNNDDDERKEMNWMQRTLSHFGQPTTDSFLQNIKNNIPAKPAELNLKTIADHLLQFPRPATMIANMSEMFSTDNHVKTQEEPAEQTLAWYMALAYAMGARSNEEEEVKKSTEFHTPLYSSACAGQEIEAKKRRDKRLFSFWVPMLCRKLHCTSFFFFLSLSNMHPSF
ncbi:uncharacterized protein EV154DRAFT_410860 [Mucor mucedo]|uniref:uncharacterized protein n=1 Tax=Mucor mucedo TaxID=29922 RepID=UPI00221F9634|nr:uncharacterized protein EV154DRAFT_410860 [Mucor mucedo]KAI7896939.1 hypothetical protein EV154DRAFT_410860 [Mucor mucedo]